MLGTAAFKTVAVRAALTWTVFVIAAVVSSVLVLLRPIGQRLSDLHIYYGAASTVNAGRPLYSYVAENGGPFTYPPFAVLLFRPFTLLPEGAVQFVWLVATCLAVVAIARAVGRGLGAGPLAVAAMACALLVSAPVQSNLRFGQVSIFIVLLALVDAMNLVPLRYRGILVGVAAAIKLTPLLFVVYFLFTRRYKDAARALGAFVACALLAALVLPADSWRYWTGTILQTSRIGDLASLGNQSVHGMLLRVGVSPAALPLIWAGLIAVICGLALLRARKLQASGDHVRAAVLVGCATVAASPVSWTHHQVWTVLAAMLLVATEGAWRRAAGWVLLAVMTLSFGAVLRGISTYPGWQFLLENARSIGLVLVCLAGFGGAAVVSARRGRTAVAFVAAALVVLALTPLPAGADPTFKAYSAGDLTNPRYFYFSADPLPGEPVRFLVRREKTKVRVNGVAGDSVAGLRFTSAPGGLARTVPLLSLDSGMRTFSFRSANLAHGRLEALAPDGAVVAVYTEF
ncbi:glycosyltransferase 87 family protein [Dactylosporangium sp. NPDC005572]|uniref:glycosyltransferase 87 family protein n=1 Tax=Dactylosporangium sp. NPDC005572 TaxID=3156889 RepID=UPI0033A75480